MQKKMKHQLQAITAALIVAFGAIATAAPAAKDVKGVASVEKAKQATGYDLKNLPEVLQNAKTTSGLQIQKTFVAQGGLQGWVVKQAADAKEAVVYTTQDGKLLIAGMLLSAQGENLTSKYAEEHVTKPDYSNAYAAFQKEAAGVLVGDPKAKAEILVLFDPNCGYCKVLHRLLAPSIDAGDLRVRYVPVGILGPTSVDKSAALLESAEPGAYITQAVAGTAVAPKVKSKLAEDKVLANNALMQKYGFSGTPAVLYSLKGAKGEAVQVSTGLPTMSTLFAQLGIPGRTDALKMQPDLAQYLR